jgi:hypothetical protein
MAAKKVGKRAAAAAPTASRAVARQLGPPANDEPAHRSPSRASALALVNRSGSGLAVRKMSFAVKINTVVSLDLPPGARMTEDSIKRDIMRVLASRDPELSYTLVDIV